MPHNRSFTEHNWSFLYYSTCQNSIIEREIWTNLIIDERVGKAFQYYIQCRQPSKLVPEQVLSIFMAYKTILLFQRRNKDGNFPISCSRFYQMLVSKEIRKLKQNLLFYRKYGNGFRYNRKNLLSASKNYSINKHSNISY
jgi:hypothetical protein